MKFPFIQQLDRMDCGPVCLQMVSKYYGKNYSISFLREICDLGKDGASLLGLKRGAETLGLNGYGINSSIAEIESEKLLPIILYWNQDHFIVLYQIKKHRGKYRFYIADPSKGKYILEEEEFISSWTGKSNFDDRTQGIGMVFSPNELFYTKKPEANAKQNDTNLKFISGEVLKFKRYYLRILSGIGLSLVIQVMIPFISKSIFDFGIASGDFKLVILFIAAQALLAVFNILITFFRNWITLYIGSRINISIISKHLSKLLRLHFTYFDRKNSGDIIQRINDNSRIEDFLTSNFVTIVSSLSSLLVFQIVLVIFNRYLFIFFNLVLIIYFLWVNLILKKIKNLDYQRFDSASKNQSFIIQLINGIQDIKLSNAVTKKVYEWGDLREKLYQYNQKYIILKQVQDLGSFLIINLSTMSIIAYASYAVINKTMTIGELIAIQFILAQLVSPIDNIVQYMKAYNDFKISIERLNEINDYPVEPPENAYVKPIRLNHDLVFKNVGFSYPGTNKTPSLQHINVTILQGKVNAIVGESGSGKTTFVKLLLKMYPPDQGTICIGNQNLENIEFDTWRKATSSVMQDGYIFSDTILNNIILDGGEIDREKLNRAIKIANIQDYIDKLALGLQTKIGLDGAGLSQGQKQRLLIARCVYKNPQLIIFDEATNALDSINENIIYNNLQQYYKDKTVIAIAHRLSTVKNADQIIVFNNGNIVETGTHDQLLKKSGVYYKLIFNQQFDNVINS